MRRVASGILPAITVNRAAAKPLYLQLCEAYRAAVAERRLRGGDRIPSSRTLAAELRISRIPVLNAYEQLIAEGYFESRRGSGTFVARALPDEAPPATGPAPGGRPRPSCARAVARRPAVLRRIGPEPWTGGAGAFRLSEPAVDFFPRAVWSRLVARHARHMSREAMLYGSPMGPSPFREAVAAYLRAARALRCEADQVMLVSGSQQALEITARVLFDAGQPIWVEEPGYAGARDALAMAGARLVPVPVDESGLDVRAGIRRSRRARGVYVTPSHQYPLGVVMSPARRLELLEWSQTAGAWIIEDDYDSEYRYEGRPIAALQGLDRDARVIYVGTFSKVLFPALRVGYLDVPRDLIGRFSAVRDAMDICPPVLQAAALADFIMEGHFARHLRRTRAAYAERRAALADALRRELGRRLDIVGSDAGIHLTAMLSKGSANRDRAIAARAARDGLWTMPLSACYLDQPVRQGLVLGYGGSPAAQIAGAVVRLRRAMDAG
jgi:GntR family transcriptional regulator/MocR family aminotransferase